VEFGDNGLLRCRTVVAICSTISKGIVTGNDFWPMTEPHRMDDGNWIMSGIIVSEERNQLEQLLSKGRVAALAMV